MTKRKLGCALLLDRVSELRTRLEGREPVLFLDYDGTLTPIVQRPELATLAPTMRTRLAGVAQAFTVAVVSGRDRADVAGLVGLDDVIYAGSHGFDIRGPAGLDLEHAVGAEAVPDLDTAEQELRTALADVDGVQIERKRFSMAVHYRNVPEEHVGRVRETVDRAIRGHAGRLRTGHGKRVLEIQPQADWDKGRAVLWLLGALDRDSSRTMPIYVGDDVTDEDAFEALREHGIGVLVADEERPTAACYRLRNVDEVGRFLDWLVQNRHGARSPRTA